ncbi:thiamine ABC transporter substrate binding subunit [Salinarimonas sp.]|uniref:thiamine ABC transporter substrate binding subunit n=1 Tax=Salinarimonas sp. TaxID=2766526 RepID=UPI00391D9FD3
MSRLVAPLAIAASLAAPLPAHAQPDIPTLTVYTYSSFVGRYGPGAAIGDLFEERCGCRLEWVASDDSGSLLGRLRLEGETTGADVVLGLDMNLAHEARALGLFAPHGRDTGDLDLPIAWEDDVFLPFDWGHLAFVYDETRLPAPPTSLRALVEDVDGPSLVLQDPRTSAPGFGFLLWMEAVFGEEAPAAWEKLAPRVVTFTSGWSQAYGLFLEGEADMVLSYQTSPAYHRAVENETRYRAAAFEEGHYLHVEIAGMIRTSAEPELARDFLDFMLSDDFQALIPQGNWMFPARIPEEGLPEAFDDLIEPATSFLFDPEQVARDRRALIDAWLAATAR